MYYVDCWVMIASSLKPRMLSNDEILRLRNNRNLIEQKKNRNLTKSLIASICFLICIAVVPERPSNLASICEKYNSSAACEVW